MFLFTVKHFLLRLDQHCSTRTYVAILIPKTIYLHCLSVSLFFQKDSPKKPIAKGTKSQEDLSGNKG